MEPIPLDKKMQVPKGHFNVLQFKLNQSISSQCKNWSVGSAIFLTCLLAFKHSILDDLCRFVDENVEVIALSPQSKKDLLIWVAVCFPTLTTLAPYSP